MKFKTFVADSIPEAFQAIKSELGPDAVILSTTYTRTGWDWRHPIGRQQVQVVAAVDGTARSNVSAEINKAGTGAAGEDDATEAAAGFMTFRSWLEASLGRDGAGLHSQESGEAARASSHEQRRVREEYRVSSESDPPNSAGRQARSSLDGDREPGQVDRLTLELSQELVTRGCDLWTATRLAAEAFARAAMHGSPAEVHVRRALREVVMDQVRVSGPPFTGQKRLKAIAVIGPTGVGKTSAIAKLAGHYRLKEGRSVAVAKVERESIGGVDPLRVFGGFFGLKIETVSGKEALSDLVSTNGGAELLLIDTPGYSLLNWGAMEWLRGLLSDALPLEVHLTLPANTDIQDFLDVASGYTGLPVHRLLFTKLDETTRFGRLFEILCRSRLPVSYLTAGQSALDDLQPATPERLADLICGTHAEFGRCDRRDSFLSDGGTSGQERRPPGSNFKSNMPTLEVSCAEGGRRWTKP
ncbi:MAG: hypothetical protein NW703_09295 [Nitrospiraceae bacterium]